MVVALASDHTAVLLREELATRIRAWGHTVREYGMFEGEPHDYPIYGVRAARAVASGACDTGIILCGTGAGISMAAGKVPGIRCCCCSDCYTVKLTRLHNDANMLAMGARVVGVELACMMAEIFLSTPYEGGRHDARVAMIAAVERGEDIETEPKA